MPSNALVGHHGIFSLTPIWLLSVFGTFYWLLKAPDRKLRELALLIGAVSLVCICVFHLPPAARKIGITAG